MANTNKRPEEVPEQRIKLTVNYLTDEDYESIDKNRLSTELSNQLFMTPGNGGGIKECAMAGRGAQFDQMASDVGQMRSVADDVKTDVRSLSADAVGRANGISSGVNSLSVEIEALKS